VIPARGMAVGDLFNDGKLDAVINVEDQHPVILRNVNPDHNHWLELKLVGRPQEPARRSGRDGIRNGEPYATACGCDERRKLYFFERSAAALWIGRGDNGR
jgi:hypothetical protein